MCLFFLFFLVAMVFVLMTIYFPFFTGTGILTVYTRGTSYTVCSLRPSAMIRDYFVVWLILDLCLFFVIPFGLMLVCNMSILAKVVCLANKRRAQLQGGGKPKAAPPTSKSQKMLKTVTRRVVILSITYCVCNAPISIFNAILISGNADDVIPVNHVEIYRTVFHLLMYLNNGVNFFLYCMIGSGFRKDFMNIFRPGSNSFS